MRRTTYPRGFGSIFFTDLFVWSAGDGHTVPWPFVRLLSEPTLDSERSVGTGAAILDLCGTGVEDVGWCPIDRAVGSSRGPGAVIACSILVLLGCVRHVER